MTISLYDMTAGACLQILACTADLMDKAKAHADAQGIPEADLMAARLAPDMWDLAMQVKATVLFSAGALEGVIAGEFVPAMPDDLHDLAALKAHVEQAIARITALDRAAVEGVVGKDACFKGRMSQMDFTAEAMLATFVMPNFYFHATTVYDILRAQGVPLAKRDYMGAPRLKTPA
ncbi:DUF1993 family protein [Novosphingobium sp. FSY-8]|uniref:DUF1993 family protein n=1 Tax=Novosphingobium ovatum TaxID=1908523 RepID=A0ABW9XAF0_9SPHN|nr:DUF1993 domain-containing protein [Novosphingobium ovatum]NBC35506.1 DUF1993 family protein [Novosphingobium ovatum]